MHRDIGETYRIIQKNIGIRGIRDSLAKLINKYHSTIFLPHNILECV